ncbi:hypothetical protein [Pedobacter ginsengisoli]|uniref:hypothetical protein n=1 Tax=Pedobacter ginsengisoli TaxID=363852 RepID=UPI00254DCF21|nr:hypothetical protein [Pedobacter ginsengisoli]
MRNTLLLVLFLTGTSAAFAQMSGDYNYSIGIRGYTVMQMPKILNESGSKYFTNSTLNGVMVKFNDNQISYRLNGTYYNKSKQFFNNCATCEEANGKLVDYSFKVGFEKNFNYARIQPYFAIDIGYRSNTFSGQTENRNELKASEMASIQVEASKTGFVLTPVLGIKASITDQISFFAEGNLDFFYSYERQETTLGDAANTQTFKRYYKAEFLLNPFSVGIQVHLGSNK